MRPNLGGRRRSSRRFQWTASTFGKFAWTLPSRRLIYKKCLHGMRLGGRNGFTSRVIGNILCDAGAR